MTRSGRGAEVTEGPPTAVVLIAHGTVESLDDLPPFLANIRRGHAPPPELVEEVRRRYEAIGGRSPLLDITHELARKVERSLGLPTRVAMRLWDPYPKDVLSKLVSEGIRRVVTVPLAQHSAPVYGAAMAAAAKEIDPTLEVLCAPNWGRRPELTRAFADRVGEALAQVPAGESERTALVLTAHSLPVAVTRPAFGGSASTTDKSPVVRGGDPYEREFRGSAEDLVGELRARSAPFSEHRVAFQSQGIGTGMEWLGPDLRSTLEDLAGRGMKHVVLAPVGFLADHVEILYDLDIEAQAWCGGELEIVLYRSTSLNAGDGLVSALAAVARDVLSSAQPSQARELPGSG